MRESSEYGPENCHGFVRFLKVMAATGITLHVLVLLGFGLILVQVWRMMTPMDPVFQRLTNASEAYGVDSGDDVELLRQLHVRLQNMAASSSDAKAAQFVHVVFVEFAEADAAQPDAGPAEQPERSLTNRLSVFGKDTRTATLDVSGLDKGAAVFIANHQVVWQIEGADQDDFAKIGFEGPYVFDLDGGHPGLLAAFRVEAFGSDESSRLRDFDSLTHDQRAKHRFCATVERWGQYFDVPDSMIRTWYVSQPSRLAVTMDGPSNSQMGKVRSRRYENYCRV